MVLQHYECISYHRTVYLKIVKMVSFMLLVFYHSKKLKTIFQDTNNKMLKSQKILKNKNKRMNLSLLSVVGNKVKLL